MHTYVHTYLTLLILHTYIHYATANMAINTLAQERASTHRSAFRIRRLKSISAFQSKVSHRDIVIRLSASVHQNTSTHTNTHRYTYKHICGALCSKIHSFAMPTLLKLHVGGAVQQFDSIASMCMYIYTYVYSYRYMYLCVCICNIYAFIFALFCYYFLFHMFIFQIQGSPIVSAAIYGIPLHTSTH